MATTGLYSQHLHNRKVLYLRNTIIAIILIVLGSGDAVSHLLYVPVGLWPQRGHRRQYAHHSPLPADPGIL